MPDWVQIILAAAPGFLTAGAAWYRLGRLESDQKLFATRETTDMLRRDVDRAASKESVEGLRMHLEKIEGMIQKLSDELREKE